jgi:hypothetical protein
MSYSSGSLRSLKVQFLREGVLERLCRMPDWSGYVKMAEIHDSSFKTQFLKEANHGS